MKARSLTGVIPVLMVVVLLSTLSQLLHGPSRTETLLNLPELAAALVALFLANQLLNHVTRTGFHNEEAARRTRVLGLFLIFGWPLFTLMESLIRTARQVDAETFSWFGSWHIGGWPFIGGVVLLVFSTALRESAEMAAEIEGTV
ncbi:DUF2975 domain-containing protein [Lentzea tibetensis]|uniref:DUF2975 domain-containing protein n=1 Tax=Lentzea tibetensis TaxID=2591470 RepID=A0A563ELC9_9PSEU|nr:DUF2975 domain-containing protein [Lentzea tibetensis]TWP47909.1 DUF2975 domain-containing protein [Lentzea tibetensis]